MEREELEKELERYKQEKEQIRQVVGMIGGVEDSRINKVMNIIFVILIFFLLIFDIVRYGMKLDLPLPPMISMEFGILLISLKIIWMMHKQTKLEHFQFWILNSLEFRLNDIQKKLTIIEKK